jgi:Flp pilus assembly protein TadD
MVSKLKERNRRGSYWLIPVLGGLAVVFMGTCGGQKEGAEEDLLRSGRAALAKGNNTRAVALLQKALDASPRNARVRLALVLALERIARLREAERILRDGLVLQPGKAALWGALGRILRRRGKYDQAVKSLDRARKLDPSDPDPALQLGEIYERYQKREIARSHYRAVLAAADRPAHRVLAHQRLARLALRENKLTEAIAQLRGALRIVPRRASLLGELGEALRLAGRPAEALGPLRLRVRLEPDSGPAQLGLGLALRELGNHGQAVRALRLATKLRPKMVAPLLPLAQSLLALDRREEAYLVGVKALALAPQDPAVMWFMAPLYHARKHFESAAALVKQLREARSHDAEYWQLAGAVHTALGRHMEARQDYARALTLRPRDSRLVRLVAFAARRSGNYKAAQRHLLAVLKLDPQDYEAIVHLAISEENLGRRAAARARLLRLVQSRPKRAEAHLYLGWIALRRGGLAEAVRRVRLADRLAGGQSAHALDVLARALLRSKQVAEARKVVDRALALPLSSGDRAYFQKLVDPKSKPRPRPLAPRPRPLAPRPRPLAPRK